MKYLSITLFVFLLVGCTIEPVYVCQVRADVIRYMKVKVVDNKLTMIDAWNRKFEDANIRVIDGCKVFDTSNWECIDKTMWRDVEVKMSNEKIFYTNPLGEKQVFEKENFFRGLLYLK